MSLLSRDIDRIASLARLRLEPAEADAMLHQINAFFDIVERMRAVDTSGVEPLAHPLDVLQPLPLRLRDDVAVVPQIRDQALANAPLAQDGMFIVPRVIE